MKLILRWIVSAVAVAAAIYLVPGLSFDGRIETLFVVALILGLVNAIVRPIIKALACGLIVLTLGLFLFVINAAMLWITSIVARSFGFGFEIDGFIPAFVGALVISVVSWILSILIPDDPRR